MIFFENKKTISLEDPFNFKQRTKFRKGFFKSKVSFFNSVILGLIDALI